ncbi:hypothetical protein SPB_0569 [Streptococcus parauberis NCFD 2020]|uniref:Uncharacterized protein n=1 Tax=Streptococcus parauberis NCFD 2020 TaxID=873447 RepID=F1Z047_9STRE|nr:hypothetical protein SPB_0569 [Streptococcus parauberis NCFD 2020]
MTDNRKMTSQSLRVLVSSFRYVTAQVIVEKAQKMGIGDIYKSS